MKKKFPFGIDLGTTFSSVAVNHVNGGPRVIKDNSSKSAIPSVVSFLPKDKKYEIVCGSAAQSKLRSNIKSTIYDTKRMFGQRYNNPTIEYMKKNWEFSIEKAPNEDQILIDIPSQNKKLLPYEVTSHLLKHLIEVGFKGVEPELRSKEAVITVPANFTEVQREETLKAAEMAGIDVKCLLNEPTAAGIACAYLNDFFYESDSSNVVIFDFGGGTLDISLLYIENNNKKLNFTVKAVEGDNHLGGRNFDEILLNYAIEKENLDRKNLRLMACARNAVIDTKILLSQQDEADIIIEYGDDIYTIPMTKSKFAELTKDLIDRIILPVERVLKAMHMKPSDIDQIILNGGSSNLFFVKQKLTDYFGKEPYTPVDPQDAVAKGAAIVAYNIVNKVDGHTETPIIFKEVASRSIGVAQLNGKMSFHIHKNEGLPIVDRKEIYSNHDYLEGLSIPIFEGESENVEENDFLGNIEIHGIPLCPQGEAQIEVSFNMNDNGILHVSASLVEGNIHKEMEVMRNIGKYSENDQQRDLILATIKKHKSDEISPKVTEPNNDPAAMKDFYQNAFNYFNNPSNNFKIFLGSNLLKNVLEECENGIQEPFFSSKNIEEAKNKIKNMISRYIVQKGVPKCLQ